MILNIQDTSSCTHVPRKRWRGQILTGSARYPPRDGRGVSGGVSNHIEPRLFPFSFYFFSTVFSSGFNFFYSRICIANGIGSWIALVIG